MQQRGWLVGLCLIPVLVLGWCAFGGERSRTPRSAVVETSPRADVPDEPLSSSLPRDEGDAPASRREESEAEPLEPEDEPLAATTTPAQRSFVVTVTDPDGSRLAGASVQGAADGWSQVETTGVEGVAELDVPRAHERLVLRVECEGYAHRRIESETARGPTVMLQPALVLTGRVLDRNTRAPIPAAVVEREHTQCSGCAFDRCVTDAAGCYRLERVPCGSDEAPLRFFVRAAGYLGERPEFFVRERVGELVRDFELGARDELHGRVLDLETGAPLAGASVHLCVDVLRTDAGGFFSSASTAALDRAADPQYRHHLEIRAQGYATWLVALAELESPVVARLPRGARIAGTVRGPDGEPVPRAKVRLENWSFADSQRPQLLVPEKGSYADPQAPTLSDENGRFRFEGVLPWIDTHVLVAELEGFSRLEAKAPALEPGQELEAQLVFRRGSGCVLHGAFTFNGKPARGAVVCTRGRESTSVLVKDGQYRFESIPEGTVRLAARLDDPRVHDLIPEANATVVLEKDGEVRHDFRLQLSMDPISGTVLYEDGAPGEDVGVRVSSTGQPSYRRTGRTGTLGAFRIYVPRGLSYSVTASVGKIESTRSNVDAGARGVDLVLPKLGSVLVRMLPDTGDPQAPGFRAFWRPAGVGEFAWTPLEPKDEQGFSRLRLPVGAVDLRLKSLREDLAPVERFAVPVRAEGESERVTFEAPRGG